LYGDQTAAGLRELGGGHQGGGRFVPRRTSMNDIGEIGGGGGGDAYVAPGNEQGGPRLENLRRTYALMFEQGIASGVPVAVRRGALLHTLEQALAPHTPADLRLKIPNTTIRPGELLWQGAKKGFCIATSAPHPAESEVVVDVLTLQDELPVTFQARYAIPVRTLLYGELSRVLAQLTEKQAAEVDALVDELVVGFEPPRTT
jgi:hypothetical protein